MRPVTKFLTIPCKKATFCCCCGPFPTSEETIIPIFLEFSFGTTSFLNANDTTFSLSLCARSLVKIGKGAMDTANTFLLFSSSIRIAAIIAALAPPSECPQQITRPVQPSMSCRACEMIHRAAFKTPLCALPPAKSTRVKSRTTRKSPGSAAPRTLIKMSAPLFAAKKYGIVVDPPPRVISRTKGAGSSAPGKTSSDISAPRRMRSMSIGMTKKKVVDNLILF